MARQAYSRPRTALLQSRLRAITASVLSVASISWFGVGFKTAHRRDAASTVAAFTRLENVPSHNGYYRASLVPPSAPPRLGDYGSWSLVISTVDGKPVTGAAIALDGWRPDDEASGTRRYVIREMGNGQYRVDRLRMDQPGWWNVRLALSARGVADSLAFNLVF